MFKKKISLSLLLFMATTFNLSANLSIEKSNQANNYLEPSVYSQDSKPVYVYYQKDQKQAITIKNTINIPIIDAVKYVLYGLKWSTLQIGKLLDKNGPSQEALSVQKQIKNIAPKGLNSPELKSLRAGLTKNKIVELASNKNSGLCQNISQAQSPEILKQSVSNLNAENIMLQSISKGLYELYNQVLFKKKILRALAENELKLASNNAARKILNEILEKIDIKIQYPVTIASFKTIESYKKSDFEIQLDSLLNLRIKLDVESTTRLIKQIKKENTDLYKLKVQEPLYKRALEVFSAIAKDLDSKIDNLSLEQLKVIQRKIQTAIPELEKHGKNINKNRDALYLEYYKTPRSSYEKKPFREALVNAEENGITVKAKLEVLNKCLSKLDQSIAIKELDIKELDIKELDVDIKNQNSTNQNLIKQADKKNIEIESPTKSFDQKNHKDKDLLNNLTSKFSDKCKENFAKQDLDYNDILHEKVMSHRVEIARKICDQNSTKHIEDRTFDTSDISSDFLREMGLTKEDIKKLKNADDLQSYMHREFIYHISANQNLKQELGNNSHLSGLIDGHQTCIKKGLEYNKVGDTSKAIAFADLCWNIVGDIKSQVKTLANIGYVALETVHALDKVLYKAFESFIGIGDNFIRDYFKRPEAHINSLVDEAINRAIELFEKTGMAVDSVIFEPLETSKKLFNLANYLINKISEFKAKCINFCIDVETNPERAKEKIILLQEQACTFFESVKEHLQEKDQLEISREIGALTVDVIATGQVLKLGKMVGGAAFAKISNDFNKIAQKVGYALAPSTAAKTAEGVTMAIECIENTVANKAENLIAVDAIKTAESTLVGDATKVAESLGEKFPAIEKIPATENFSSNVSCYKGKAGTLSDGRWCFEHDGIDRSLVPGHGNPTTAKGPRSWTLPENRYEQFAMREVMSNPDPKACGAKHLKDMVMKDTKNNWLDKDGWKKYSKNYEISGPMGKKFKFDIHYLWNEIKKEFADFKFVDEIRK